MLEGSFVKQNNTIYHGPSLIFVLGMHRLEFGLLCMSTLLNVFNTSYLIKYVQWKYA